MQSHCIRRFFSKSIASNYRGETRNKFLLIIALQKILLIPIFVSWFLLSCQKLHFQPKFVEGFAFIASQSYSKIKLKSCAIAELHYTSFWVPNFNFKIDKNIDNILHNNRKLQ